MSSLLTPGLYRQPALPVQATGALARGDVALFLGYAGRGPTGVPVRVESLALFEALFGQRPAHGFLWPAIKGFFENGGIAAYALRLTGKSASAASARAGSWIAHASFPWPMIDPRRLRGSSQATAAAWVTIFEAQIREQARSADPGTWGNRLSFEVRRSARAQTESVPDAGLDPLVLAIASLAGIEARSVLELTQVNAGGLPVSVRVQAEALDAARRTLRLPRSAVALGLDPRRAIQVASVEFRVDIYFDGKLEQRFDGLSPDAGHSRSLATVLRRECRSLHLDPPHGDVTDPENWPSEGSFVLRGGSDGLTDVSAETWLEALSVVERLSEPALIAVPDLVLPRPALQTSEASPDEPRDCSVLSVLPEGRIAGRVTTGDRPNEPGSGPPVPGVQVDVAGKGGQTTTDSDGRFGLTHVSLGLVTLRLTRPGFEALEVPVQSSAFAAAPIPFELLPITQARALTDEEVLEVANALGNPALVGAYKVAIVDPPASVTTLDELRSWRSRLGDTARVGFFAPWLRVTGPASLEEELVSIPASGHVCGAFAAAEREAGIHRSGANRPLRFIEGLTFAIDDAEQALLNPVGINAIRAFPGRGIRINGARTAYSDPEWRFLSTRRVVDAIEKTLEASLAWVVFEPNNVLTRHAVTVSVSAFLNRLWRQGILAGAKPEAAYSVKCDSDNNIEADQGRFTVDIGVAPTEPYEFVLFRLGHAQDALKVTE